MESMASVALERTLVKSPPELWDELASEASLSRWLGTVRVRAKEPPRRLEWDSDVAQGVIELEASGWGTRIRAEADASGPAWERLHKRYELEGCLRKLLDDLGASSLTSR
jgi:hypothetical protein